jgi:ribosomal protein S18 acetylase RimI-like enzyme
LRPLSYATASQVLSAVGPIVDALYPQGGERFAGRLQDVLQGYARCTVAQIGQRVVGVAVETPKGARRVKLSTLWVHPIWRRRGVGSALLRGVTRDWLLEDIERVHLTVAVSEYTSIFGLLNRFSFQHLEVERNRYGIGRDEAILACQCSDLADAWERQTQSPNSPNEELFALRRTSALSRTLHAA